MSQERTLCCRPGAAVVAASLLLVGMGWAGTVPASAHEVEYANRGLAAYGPSGPIQRTDLPAGIQNRVTDRTLALAVSPELAAARDAWDSHLDFVGQIDYQLRFRAQTDYLSTEPDHLGALLLDRPRNVGIELYQLYLTHEEAAELKHRLELGDRIEAVMGELGALIADFEGAEPQYHPNFAGVWQDQHDGGAIVVSLVDASQVDRAALARLVGGEHNLRVLDGQYSWDQVEGFADSLIQQIRSAGLEAEVRINSTSEGRRLEIVAPNPKTISRQILRSVPAEIVSLVEGPMDAPEGAPNTTHASGDQMPGLRYDADPGGWCSWGVNGHTSSYNYIVTAGHCGDPPYENHSGWTGDFEMHQNNSLLLTAGDVFVYSFKVEDYDVKRVTSSYANDNCYHSTAHCTYSIERRALHNSWEINSDLVCMTMGQTGVYECGFVTQENYNSSGCNGDRWVRYSIDTSGGDSGSGLIGPGSQASIDAIHTCGSGDHGMGQTAYDVKTKLAFDFNCDPNAVTKAAPNWGACPTVNR